MASDWSEARKKRRTANMVDRNEKTPNYHESDLLLLLLHFFCLFWGKKERGEKI